jgi:hypothetical protein
MAVTIPDVRIKINKKSSENQENGERLDTLVADEAIE